MKTLTKFIFILLVIIQASCTNEDQLNPTIELIYPQENELTDYCCFNFEWESNSTDNNYRLILSNDIDFNDIILDTIVTQSYYELQEPLIYENEYFWKIMLEDLEVEASSKFTIIENPTEPTITLTYPQENELIDYCCFNFEWESNTTDNDYRLILSNNIDFNDIILDTIIQQLYFEMSDNLVPGKEYFWKINIEDLEIDTSSTFAIKDYIENYEGIHNCNIEIKMWNMIEGVFWDTLYQNEITFNKISETIINFYESSTEQGTNCEYYPFATSDENEIIFAYNFGFSNSSTCTINYEQNSIEVVVNEGGLGGGCIFTFTTIN